MSLHDAVAALRAALEAEREALVADDAVALDAATVAKDDATRQVESLVAEGGTDTLDDDLKVALRELRDLNFANGHLLATRHRQTHQLLSLLRGVDGRAGTYGPDGQTEGVGTRRSIVSA